MGQQEIHEREASGGGHGRCLYCRLTSFSRSLQINLRINLDGTREATPRGGHPVGQQEIHEHEALGGGSGRRLYCRLTSFSRSLQTNLRINLDGTWHLPIFFIIGTANANMNYFLFGIMCLTLCYALATIRKVSKGVFPCILTHCLINGLSAIFVFNYSLLSCCITLIVTIIVSILILNVNKRYIR